MLQHKKLLERTDKESRELFLRVIDLSSKIIDLGKEEKEKLPQLRFVDGSYVGILSSSTKDDKIFLKPTLSHHTWLETPAGVIIDVWPVGIISLNAILVPRDSEYGPFGAGHYIKSSESANSPITRSVKWRTTRMFNLLKDFI